MSNPILVVEDDAAIRRALCDYLRLNAWTVLEASSLAQAAAFLDAREVELVLLDRVLPDGDGLNWLKTVRQTRSRLPVLILTALGEEQQRVAGLRSGADDYIVKPFSLRELDARIAAILRRTSGSEECALSLPLAEGIEFIPQDRTVVIKKRSDSQTIILTEKESGVLRYLYSRRKQIVSRDELLRRVWDLEPYGLNTRTVDITLARLREKLPPEAVISTRRGQGYVLE